MVTVVTARLLECDGYHGNSKAVTIDVMVTRVTGRLLECDGYHGDIEAVVMWLPR